MPGRPTAAEIEGAIRRLLDQHDYRPRVGDDVMVQGMFPGVVYRVGERGCVVVTRRVWESGVPPSLSQVRLVKLNEIEPCGVTRRFVYHVGWSTGHSFPTRR